MALVKVRRDGNSLAVTIPAAEARKAHLTEGTYVNIEVDTESGNLLIEAISIQPRVRSEVISAGRRVIAENRRLYDRIAEHDSGSD